MDSLLIVAATVVAVLIVLRTIAPTHKPSFTVSERVPTRGLAASVGELGRACAKTERGKGVSATSLCRALKKTVAAAARKKEPEKWESKLVENAEFLIGAAATAKKTLGKSYMLGHVRGTPRIFALCKEIAEKTRGRVDKKLFIELVTRFSAAAPLTVDECGMLGDMLIFCLCGTICAAADGAERKGRAYDKGRSDGADGRADLDRITSDDYICGLTETAEDADAVARMAENNGIDVDAAVATRRKYVAEVYALIACASAAVKAFSALPRYEFYGLSEAYSVLEHSSDFSTADEKQKARALSAVAATARKRKTGEVDFAKECVDYVAVSGGTVERYAVPRPRFRAAVRYILPAAAAVLAVVLFCVFSPPMFSAYYVLTFAVIVTAFYRTVRVLTAPYYAPRSSGRDAHSIVYAITGAKYLEQRLDMLRAVGHRLDASIKDRKLAVLYAKLLLECITVVMCATAQLFAIVFVARLFSPTAFFVACSACIAVALVGLFRSGAELSFKPLKFILTAAMIFAVIPSSAVTAIVLCIFGKRIKRLDISAAKRRFFAVVISAQVAAGATVICVGAVFCPPMTAVGCTFLVFPLIPFVVEKIYAAISEKPKRSDDTINREDISIDCGECFGGETKTKLCLLNNGSIYITCDNRGSVTLSDCEGGAPRGLYSSGAVCNIGAHAFDLTRCGGVFAKHKAVYRAVASGAEFIAEVVAPTELAACAYRITLINRTASTVTAELSVYAAPHDGNRSATPRAVGITVCGDADVGEKGTPSVVKHCLTLGAFRKENLSAAVVFADDARGAEQSFAAAESDGFFDYAENCARGFSVRDVPVAPSLRGNHECAAELCDPRSPTLVYDACDGNALGDIGELKKYGFGLNAFLIDGRADFGPSHRNGIKTLYGARDGAMIETARRIAVNTRKTDELSETSTEPMPYSTEGILPVGKCVLRPRRPKRGIDITKNILTDGRLYAEFDGYGAAGGRCRVDGASIEIPRAFVVIEADGEAWSPTVRPCGKGGMTARHYIGRSEYCCVYGGIAATLKVYPALGSLGIVYELELEELTGEDRELAVMFAAETPRSVLPVRTAELNGGAIALSKIDGNGFAVFASENISERAYAAQAYRSYGGVRRAKSFLRGGDESALALSTAVRVYGRGKKRVSFLLAAKAGGLLARGIDVSAADGYLEDNIAFWSRLGAVRLLSSDDGFNAAYKASLYSAYINASRCDIDGDVINALASGFALKYVDTSAVSARISAACSKQTADGQFVGIGIGEPHRMLKTLLLPLVAADLAEFVGDPSVLDTDAVFAEDAHGAADSASVTEHCLRAIDAAADMICSADGMDIAALYAALGIYSFRCDRTRKQRYRELMKSMWFIGNHRLGDGDALSKLVGDGTLFQTVFALSLYEAGDISAAYSALARAAASKTERIADSYSASILFYTTVTEKFLGIKVRGSKADIDPHTSDITPHIEFSYDCDGALTRIVVDDSVESGEWQMIVGRITYSHAKLDLEKGSDGAIVFRRCAPHH